jgi:hypothetical protein
VHIKDGTHKISGTVISKSNSEIVVSERGKYGAPQLHVIKLDKEDVVVAPTKIKKATFRGDASRFVDPFRKRSLTSELALIKSQNALDFSVQGYDVKSDQFYIEGRLNAGSRFGKWVSAKDLIPLMDVNARGGIISQDELIRRFAATIGQESALTEKPKEEEKKENTEEKPEEKKAEELPQTPEQQAERKIPDETPEEEDDEPETEATPLIEKLKALQHRPVANNVQPAKTAPTQKNQARPDLKSTKDYVEDRLKTLRGKAANDNATPGASNSASRSAQAARESVILGDAAFTSGAAVPALVIAYATAGTGQTPQASQAAWQQATQQMSGLTNELNTRLSERRAQYEALSIAGAAPELLSASQSRVSALEGASANISQTFGVARGRRSAQELAALQTARTNNSTRTTSGGGTNGGSIQSTLNDLRSQAANLETALQGATDGLQAQAAAMLGTTLQIDIEQELSFELAVDNTIEARINELLGEIQELQASAEANQAAGEALQVAANQALRNAQETLATLQTARSAQQERVQAAQTALVQAKQAIAALPTTRATGGAVPPPIPAGAKTVAAAPVPIAPASSSGATNGSVAVAPPSRPQGAPTGAGIPAIRTGSSAGIAQQNLTGGTAGRLTSGPGARPGTPTTIKPLNTLPISGAASEFAALDRDRQRDRRQSGNDGYAPSVLSVPQTQWDNDDDEVEELDPNDIQDDDDSFRDDVNRANDYVSQLQSDGGTDGESLYGDAFGGGESEADDSNSNYFLKDYARKLVNGETPEAGYGEGMARDAENFRLLASAKALQAQSEALRARIRNQTSAAKLAEGKQKRMEAIEKEITDKIQDYAELSGFEAVLPVLKYLGRVIISAVNRKAGAFSLKILPGYRPDLPNGAQPEEIETQWDIFLMIELCVIVIGMITGFILFIGSQVIMFLYFFGPLIGVIGTLCHLFGSLCHISQ